ncbi:MULTISPECIES: hypothetical protein [Novosphingobium]|jgi:hypothetical protein|uniref:Uncharacterized protein n=1 Tax=Novosphingobium panipatense TaxID=428991 RepID=A0ABY1QVL5_9SPHN|nr:MULTISPECIES: hypothetical protein [Novosphingobium]SMP82105.1 hypothetical protein SAMN06296065_12131 [Novosphingobium panipatense]
MRNMNDHDRDRDRARLRESLIGNGLLFLFGCGVLGFLVAVDRVDWFSIRPATGSSVAMARASERAPRVGPAVGQPVSAEPLKTP